jgi:predicted DNA-binding protein (MmcQ/YjbR family)
VASTVSARLQKFAMSLPGVTEEFPWGERVAKVKGKVFAFLGKGADPAYPLSFSVKLPVSGDYALSLPFTEPTGYGLGKSGWVTVRFAANDAPPVDMLLAWIEESYRAVAPKKLVAELDGSNPAAAAKAAPPRKGTSRPKAATPRKSAVRPGKAGKASRKK